MVEFLCKSEKFRNQSHVDLNFVLSCIKGIMENLSFRDDAKSYFVNLRLENVLNYDISVTDEYLENMVKSQKSRLTNLQIRSIRQHTKGERLDPDDYDFMSGNLQSAISNVDSTESIMLYHGGGDYLRNLVEGARETEDKKIKYGRFMSKSLKMVHALDHAKAVKMKVNHM